MVNIFEKDVFRTGNCSSAYPIASGGDHEHNTFCSVKTWAPSFSFSKATARRTPLARIGYDTTEELLPGGSVSFQRRMRPQQGVTAEEFALTVDEYMNNRLANNEVHTSALGWLIITSARTDR